MAHYDVVIPARDEAPTVAGVVTAARAARGIGQVFVVDDGSSDATAAEAGKAGATVLSRPLGKPGSKARALALGVEASTAPILVFFDSDILHVRPDHFEALAAPVLAGEAWLSCGMISYGQIRDPLFLRLPPITGLRAIRREVFEAIPDAKRNGFQIEIMINEVIARRGLPSTIRVLPGLRHRSKIQKVGWRRGLPSHLSMTRELLACLRFVPLWTYRAYLNNLKVLPPAESSAPALGRVEGHEHEDDDESHADLPRPADRDRSAGRRRGASGLQSLGGPALQVLRPRQGDELQGPQGAG